MTSEQTSDLAKELAERLEGERAASWSCRG